MQTERHKRPLVEDTPSKTSTSLSHYEQWNSWKWQFQNRIRSSEDLISVFGDIVPDDISVASAKFPMAITPYYASLIREFNEKDPIYRMAVPSGKELYDPPFLSDDPLGEEADSPVKGLVHRYNDRALIISTSVCAMYCRHCTRKRVTGQKEHCCKNADVQNWVTYLKAHPEIKDVVVSGGDPFTMETHKLDEILTAIRSVESVETIRIGTRTPVVMPMRIDQELVTMLKKHHPLYVNVHFNHPYEITPESQKAIAMLADAGIPLGNQSVLLEGVNNDPLIMENLCRKLVKMRIKPYYLFICDLVKGVEHFRTSVSDGLKIMEHLRGRISGMAIPSFVIDLPGGGGKIPLLPDYVASGELNSDDLVFRNYLGEEYRYRNPSKSVVECD
jgi:lysine 2,3-aminomutase